MFRRNRENKAKLEHKLYLARETPEPVFDVSECAIRHVPQGIYSLCRVFLKEVLRLDHNNLSSLSGGGQLKDLHCLRVLDIQHNAFLYLPEEIHVLKNLRELYVNNNQLKKLPENMCHLNDLRIVDASHNCLKRLPENLGNLTNLRKLKLGGNKLLNQLPKSICGAQKLSELQLDAESFCYPPQDIVEKGTGWIMQYICTDVGLTYIPPDQVKETLKEEVNEVENEDYTDSIQAKIWELENIKKQKVQEFLEIERANELLQKQELAMANAQKINRDKLLADITQQQYKFDMELTRIHQIKELDRFRLIEQLQEVEQNADVAIKQLLAISRQPLIQLLEQEKREEERLLAAASKYNETLRKSDILADMEDILQQETLKFQQFHESRMESSRSILEQEMISVSRLSEILESQDSHKAELIVKLQEDGDLQKAAVGALLERGDARSWGLVQQVRLVESQLAALTVIEIDKKKLQIDDHLNDLAEKRTNLSFLLIDLLEQQNERRMQLLSTLQILEESSNTADDFWLRQYQRLLDKLPIGLSEAQKNMDPALAQALLMNGVINCLPFLAKLTQCQYDVENITDHDLLEAGITNRIDRLHILDAFQIYNKETSFYSPRHVPTAPVMPLEEASAPPTEQIRSFNTTAECVICLDLTCEVIFVPCGHLCCCPNCSSTVEECPFCRSDIERKIRVIIA